MTTILNDSAGQALIDSNGTPLTVEVQGDLWTLPPGPDNTQAFFAMELDVFQPGGASQSYVYGRMSHPRMAVTLLSQINANTASLYASDLGYRSLASDSIGVRVYPAVMDRAFEIDRMIGLAPGSQSTAGNGLLRLSNLGRRYDSFVQGRNSDSRPVRLLMGTKTYDETRGIYVDPSYGTLSPFFVGTAGSWAIGEDGLEIQMYDATYWADRPLQSNLYAGTGGLNGGADLAGKAIPMVRGGTTENPVQNVPLVMIDAVNLILQYTDGPGTVVTLYEGGAPVFAYDSDVADIYAGSAPAAGHYRTCNAKGLVQMGSSPVRAMTADVTGSFVSAGAVSAAANIARFLLTETMGLPASMIDLPSFATANTAYPYTAGFYAGNNEAGLEIVRFLLGSIGAALYTSRAGRLSCLALRRVTSAGSAPRISTTTATELVPQTLNAPLDPPAYRWRVGYNRMYSVQKSDFNGAVTAARKALIGTEYQLASWISSSVQAMWLRPSDPEPVGTALLVSSDAQALASDLGDLWSQQPRLWTATVPITAAVGLDVGDVVRVNWPVVDLITDRPGQIVGEQARSFDSTVQFSILVSGG